MMPTTLPSDSHDETPLPGRQWGGRVALIALFALFFVPILVSLFWNIAHPGWLPFGTVNRGVLLKPALALEPEQRVSGHSANSTVDAGGLEGHWSWALYADGCAKACAARLAEIARAKVALGRNTARVQPVVLLRDKDGSTTAAIGDVPVFALARSSVVALDAALAAADAHDAHADGAPRMLLIDPQSFVIAAYAADATAEHWLKDIRRLLRISKLDSPT